MLFYERTPTESPAAEDAPSLGALAAQATALPLVQQKNSEFARNVEMYNAEYFEFMQRLVAANAGPQCQAPLARYTVNMALFFLQCYGLRVDSSLRATLPAWVNTLNAICVHSPEACSDMAEALANSPELVKQVTGGIVFVS
jgi:hypothetical protein